MGEEEKACRRVGGVDDGEKQPARTRPCVPKREEKQREKKGFA
jgi:hypothetical protein